MWQVLVDRTVIRSTIHSDVEVPGVSQTISRSTEEANLYSNSPSSLTPKHRRLRIQWGQVTATWNTTYCQNVALSDESWFILETNDNRVRVWRRPGERYNSAYIVVRHSVHIAGVMVLGGHKL